MPPRLMGDQMQVPDGYHVVDTLATMLTDQGRQGQFGYNPYAAMPSLHFAWALIRSEAPPSARRSRPLMGPPARPTGRWRGS